MLIGARSGSKTPEFKIPSRLPPGSLQDFLPLRVTRVESLREGLTEASEGFNIRLWLEHIETDLPAEWTLADGRGVLYRHKNFRYVAGSLDDSGLRKLMTSQAIAAGLSVRHLPEGVRLRRLGELQFAFNYNSVPASIQHVLPPSADFLLGGVELAPAAVAVWRD